MKILIKYSLIILLLTGFVIIFHSCKKEGLPTLSTSSISNITATSASSGGVITSDGGAVVTARGICWCVNADPTTSGARTNDGNGDGQFTSNLTGLTAGTLYHVRAYASNSVGTAYGDDLSFTTIMADIDDNVYKVVTIGTQIWMAENLKTTRLNDGTSIQETIDWEVTLTPGYCWYNNDIAANKDIYGALYTYNTAISGNLCPSGWHVPDAAEWDTLVTFLGGKSVAGGKLKESGSDHWNIGNTGTNDFGFTALPGGLRGGEYPSNFGEFGEINERGVWWSTTKDYKYNYKTVMYIDYNSNSLNSAALSGYWGFSVRCLQN